jgi:hypothetical protein
MALFLESCGRRISSEPAAIPNCQVARAWNSSDSPRNLVVLLQNAACLES